MNVRCRHRIHVEGIQTPETAQEVRESEGGKRENETGEETGRKSPGTGSGGPGTEKTGVRWKEVTQGILGFRFETGTAKT